MEETEKTVWLFEAADKTGRAFGGIDNKFDKLNRKFGTLDKRDPRSCRTLFGMLRSSIFITLMLNVQILFFQYNLLHYYTSNFQVLQPNLLPLDYYGYN